MSNAIDANAIGTNAIGTNAIGTNAIGTNAIGTNAIGTNAIDAATLKKPRKTRKNPCPKGTRYNPKTNLCEPKPTSPKERTEQKINVVNPVTLAETKKTRKKPCPKGERYNPKTKLCEKKPSTVVQGQTQEQAQAAPAPLEPAAPAPAPAPAPEETSINMQNEIKNKQELAERDELDNTTTNKYDFLYPSLNDPLFNVKIAERKEFNDNLYDGIIHPDIAAQAELLCNADFELASHQLFIRNFLSFQTPYNSLLLYHGLGSGKTCSAIGVAEEMRDYMMQMGITNEIMIVASPNVQTNFKTQLFDERKLKLVDGIWNIRTCTGNKFLKEINPMNMKGLTRENVIKQINSLIDTYYSFFGYVEFANYITRHSTVNDNSITDPKIINKIKKNKLRKVFNHRLIIIDEVHNIRMTSESKKDKRVAHELMKLISYVNTLRLLLLSATPMFNSHKEIIWLINLMNMNDRRATIELKDVFNKDGSFKLSEAGEEIGRELLERKATGYISFVRGENPYTFPYRIWTAEYAPEHTFPSKAYPTLQLNGVTPLVQPLQHISLYVVDNGEYQQLGYNYIIQRLKSGQIGNYKQMPTMENIEKFGYAMIQQPLEGLNIIYPDERLKANDPNLNFNSIELVGNTGLKRIMQFKEDATTNFRSSFDYNPTILSKYGRIFAYNNIGKYSSKIKTICERILASTGVILVYSQYIDGGLIPLVLALEECGFVRAGGVNSLFRNKPPPLPTEVKRPIYNKYVMITGDKGFSPNPAEDIKLLTEDDNINGSKVKVVLISQTGAEGLDLKFIRQVHILEPWYNMSRAEQIIGRAVRTCSHKALPFIQRNVEIYLYASLSIMEAKAEETIDLYLYRLAEIKAIQIGKVSRVLKEISVDCILNKGQLNFSEENMTANQVKPIELKLGSGMTLKNYKIGDKPYSAICDYMKACSYSCRPDKEITSENVRLDTYKEDFINHNNDKLVYKIKQLFKERFFYRKNEIVKRLNALKTPYPLVQINAALQQLIEDQSEYVTDKYGRLGILVNIGELYMFQPLELKNQRSSISERSIPIEAKHDKIIVTIPKEIKLNEALINIKDIPAEMQRTESLKNRIEKNYALAIAPQKINTGEKNWYMFCYTAIGILKTRGFSEDLLHYFIATHIFDELSLDDIILLLNQYDKNTLYKSDVFTHIKKYIKKQILIGKKNIEGFLWKNAGKVVTIVKQGVEPWHIAQSEDVKDLDKAMDDKKTDILTNLNSIIGFMNNFKTENVVVFKVKNVTTARELGSRCDQNSNKKKAIELLNTIIGKDDYKTTLDIPQIVICILQELYLRSFEETHKNNKHWFLSPPEAVLTNIEKFSTVNKPGKKIKK